ncbi:MAG: ComEC/Rec2 family competence protein, partial [Victivallales bacterium]|nr:ComEC/Rec2 family competence protein [Victivallales bacterium]
QFRQSGVMHIFAISGLHVGMLAMTLYLVFCWVPFRVRHALVPCFLLLYVLSTGMQSSALRAFLMIGIWSFHRSSLRSVSALNAVFLAAVLVLLFNPSSYLGAGFQYSFTVAGFLVLSWKSLDGWVRCLNERRMWIPELPGVFGYHSTRLRDNALKSLAVSLVAWLAGTGLNLLHRNLFIPGAVLANFAILPFVWLLFPVAGLNILLLPLGYRFGAGHVLELLLRLIDGLSALGAEHGGGRYLVPPPPWALVVFFVCLLVFVTASSRRAFMSSGVLLFIMLAYWHFVSDMASGKGEIVMFHGDESQVPSFVCIPPGRRGVSVVNVGSPGRARSILAYLGAKGANSVDMLYFTGASKDVCNGSWLMFSGVRVSRAVFPLGYSRSRYAKLAFKSAVRDGVDIGWQRSRQDGSIEKSVYSDAVFRTAGNTGGFYFSAFNPTAIFSASVAEDVNGEKLVETTSPEGKKLFRLTNTNTEDMIYCLEPTSGRFSILQTEFVPLRPVRP